MNAHRSIARTAAVAERVTIAREAAAPAVRSGSMLDVLLVPWNSPATVTDDGRNTYTESWEPGSLIAEGDAVPVYGSHVHRPGGGLERGPLIGVARDFNAAADGLHATIHLGTDEGRRVHELAALGVRAAVSIEADTAGYPAPAAGDTLIRSANMPAVLTGVATILPPATPAYPGATVLAVRTAPTEPDPDDPDPDETDEEREAREAREAAELAAGGDTGTTGRAAMLELVRTEIARAGGQTRRRTAVHPLARYGSAVEMLVAARNAPRAEQEQISRAFTEAYALHRQIARALADQITPDNPGVLPPTWLSTIFGVIDTGRPGITAMGGPASAGDTGMDIYWPYYDGDLLTLVGEQAVQKTEIVSVKVSFKRGQATLKTYAGGSDVSYQLQRRSSPSYMQAYNRLLQTSYGLITEIVFDAALVAGAGGTVVYDPATNDTDGSLLKAALFEASAKVKRATGRPADAVLVASDVFGVLGGSPWLQPPAYGTQNVPGTAQASTLRINVSGLEITEAPGMPAGNMVISNSDAARWFEDGPFMVTAEDVAKLGTDAAIWGMGITGITLPAGVVKTTPTIAAADKFNKAVTERAAA